MQTPTAEIPSTETTATGRVVRGIRAAAESTGIAFEYLLAQATHESGLDPEASNTRSSAAGLFQFTASTWLEMVRLHGADHGLADAAQAIRKSPDGRVDVTDKALKKTILDLRKDPDLSAVMAAEYARDNGKMLERRLGRTASSSDLYLAHFLGASGAARVIEKMGSNPRATARSLLPEAAHANPEIFGHARTVAGLYGTVQSRFSKILSEHGRADLAELRPDPRPEELALTPAETPLADTAAVEIADASTQVAQATEESPYFPAAIPPAASARTQPAPRSMKEIVEAIRAGEDV
jgi:hypothetical protein